MARVVPFAVDGGRSDIKTFGGSDREDDQFQHAFAEITRQQFERDTKASGAPIDNYFKVDDRYYVIGRRAITNGFKPQFKAKRYNKNYYGVLGAIAATRAFKKSVRNMFWIGTHAPEDEDYSDDLLRAVCREWTVEWQDRIYTFDIVDGVPISEPLAGYYNAVLNYNGKTLKNKGIVEDDTIMIDPGGYTTDIGVIYENGDIDYNTFQSEKIGVLEQVNLFERNFRTEYKHKLEGGDIPSHKTHEALRTGVYRLGGLGNFPVHEEAARVRRNLAIQIANFYGQYGGSANYATLILTGGGSALLEKELREEINHNNIILAERKPEELQRANARGAMKWYKMLQPEGELV